MTEESSNDKLEKANSDMRELFKQSVFLRAASQRGEWMTKLKEPESVKPSQFTDLVTSTIMLTSSFVQGQTINDYGFDFESSDDSDSPERADAPDSPRNAEDDNSEYYDAQEEPEQDPNQPGTSGPWRKQPQHDYYQDYDYDSSPEKAPEPRPNQPGTSGDWRNAPQNYAYQEYDDSSPAPEKAPKPNPNQPGTSGDWRNLPQNYAYQDYDDSSPEPEREPESDPNQPQRDYSMDFNDALKSPALTFKRPTEAIISNISNMSLEASESSSSAQEASQPMRVRGNNRLLNLGIGQRADALKAAARATSETSASTPADSEDQPSAPKILKLSGPTSDSIEDVEEPRSSEVLVNVFGPKSPAPIAISEASPSSEAPCFALMTQTPSPRSSEMKRGPGRPRKSLTAPSSSSATPITSRLSRSRSTAPKSPKTPSSSTSEAKRGRGRPPGSGKAARKASESPEQKETSARGRGRPRKVQKTPESSPTVTSHPKRGRGRPPLSEAVKAERRSNAESSRTSGASTQDSTGPSSPKKMKYPGIDRFISGATSRDWKSALQLIRTVESELTEKEKTWRRQAMHLDYRDHEEPLREILEDLGMCLTMESVLAGISKVRRREARAVEKGIEAIYSKDDTVKMVPKAVLKATLFGDDIVFNETVFGDALQFADRGVQEPMEH